MYINGVLDGMQPLTGTIDSPNTPIYIGKRGSWYFNGIIDEVRIYNRALSAAEVQEDFQNGVSIRFNITASAFDRINITSTEKN